MNENESVYTESDIYVENRKSIRITGVINVESFSEESVCLQTHAGTLIISGETLKVAKLDVDSGELVAQGKVNSLFYSQGANETKGSFFSKVFR